MILPYLNFLRVLYLILKKQICFKEYIINLAANAVF